MQTAIRRASQSSSWTRGIVHALGPKCPARVNAARQLRSGKLFCVAMAPYSKWKVDAEGDVATTVLASVDKKLGMSINSGFDSGNIEVVDMSDPTDIRLAIHCDTYCESDKKAHMQWFHYRVAGVRDQALTMRLINAADTSFPDAFDGYQACASYDLRHWFRVPTTYEDGSLIIRHTPKFASVYYAYFAPYTHDQHMKLIQAIAVRPGVTVHVLGQTLDGHDLDCLQVGEHGPNKKVVWLIARQHPGETMAEFFMEGLLERLTDSYDSVARQLLQNAVVYVVPNMNPDGSWRGHLRTNAAGANLNREWASPSAELSPEVLYTLRKMDETGVDMMVDVHGDEELPHVFFAGNEGIPGWTDRLQHLQHLFEEAMLRTCPEFQTKTGYPRSEPGQADMRLCSKQVGQRFDCLALTLEMPFKDSADQPDAVQGWSPERSKKLGSQMLSPLRQIIPSLR